MTIKTVWYNTDGRVKCVDSEDSTATIQGAEKATADTDVVGEITLDHFVTVVDGVVTDAMYGPSPITDAMWYQRIDARTRAEQQKPLTVILSTGTYTVAMSDAAQIHISAGAFQADRAKRANARFSRHVPTAEGMITVGADDLLAVIDAADARIEACNKRRGELWAKVADGTIVEGDLDEGWPS